MLSFLRSSPSLATAGASATRCFRCFSHSSTSYSDITRITISGKLHRSPELSTTSNGRQCIRYTIRSWKGGERTNYFNLMCLTDNAKSIEYLTGLPRGTKVLAEGDFSPYQLAREDGTRVARYSIFSNTLHIIERGKPDEEVAGEDAQAQKAPAPGEEVAGKDAQAQPAPTPDEEVAGKDAQAQQAPTPDGEVAGEDAQTQPAPAPAPAEGSETPKRQAPN